MLRARRLWPIAVTALAATGLVSVPAVSASAAATPYFVSTTGSDSNPGTLAAPFQTVQKCATVAVAGDSCLIRQGTYRETVTPTNSGSPGAPITFAPYNNESVTISGADPITGWTQYSGNIYSANATLPVAGETADNSSGNQVGGVVQANQLFVDSTMALTARWPNGSTDPSHPATSTAQAGSGVAKIVDSALPAGVNFTGAQLHVVSGVGWTASVNIVASTASGSLGITRRCSDPNCAGQYAKYYISGGPNALQYLDAENEWSYDPTAHKVYLWAPGGVNPSSLTVSAKQRNYAFELSGRSNINITRLKIFSASIDTDANSSKVTIDGITAKYVSHITSLPSDLKNTACGIWCSHESDTGIILNGTNQTLKNSDLSWSGGNLVASIGKNIVITNNLLRDADYIAGYPSTVKLLGGSTAKITHNTMITTGRMHVHFSGVVSGKSRIAYNNTLDYGLQTRDLGSIYTCCLSGAGTRIDHNWTHGAKTPDQFVTGIFIDDSASEFQVDHNVIWDAGKYGIKINASGGDGTAFNDLVYNNTLAVGAAYSFGGTVKDATGTKLQNNVLAQGSQDFEHALTTATVSNNLTNYGNPLVVNASVNDYHLQPTSAGVDAGLTISGVTDGSVGAAPDQGAYETGGLDWVAGCDLAVCRASTTPYLGIKGNSYDSQSGVALENGSGTDGGRNVSYISNGNRMTYGGLAFTQGATQLSMQVASPAATPGALEAHLGSANGPLVASCTVPSTGNWQKYVTISCPATVPVGAQTIVLVAKSPKGGNLFNLFSFRFSTDPVTTVNPMARVEVERFDQQQGMTLYGSSGSIAKLGYVSNGDWASYTNVQFPSTSPTTLTIGTFAVGTPNTAQKWEAHLGSKTGPIVATCSADVAGTNGAPITTSCPVTGATGQQQLYLVNVAGAPDIDWFQFS